MSEEIFSKSFNKMSASERRLLLSDISSGAFKILPKTDVEDNNLDHPFITGEQSEEAEAEQAEEAEAEEAESLLMENQGE